MPPPPARPSAPIPLAEQRPARKALERLLAHLAQRRIKPRGKPFPPVFLHGLPGTGKSALFRQLLTDAAALDPGLICRSMPAREFAGLLRDDREAEAVQEELRNTDLFILEDLQFFPAFAAPALANIADGFAARGSYFLASAVDGPMKLPALPQRLRSRLAGGLVLRLETLADGGRRKLVARALKEAGIPVAPDLLDYLAGQAGECRETLGRVARLEALARILPVPLRLSDVLPQLAPIPQPAGTSLERITALVAKNMGTDAASMRSKARHREVTWARQVAMHLARELTGKPLVEIGRHFGGRDHSTVLHALAKVADRIRDDPTTRREIERWTKEAMGTASRGG